MTRRSMLLLSGITALGAMLRITSPGRIGLWRDEVQALNIAGLPTVKEITRFLYLHESHPPLFYYLEHFVGRLTGDAATGTGLIVLLASIALIPAVFWLASLSKLRGAGAVAAALVAVSVPLQFYSVQLRPYSLVSLAMILSTVAIIQDRTAPSRWWRVLWAGVALGLLYLHHASVIIVFAQSIVALVLAKSGVPWRIRVRRWAPFIGAVAMCAIPDMVMLAHQGAVAAYPARRPIEVWSPFRELWGLAVAFPGEIGLAILGAIACLLVRGGRTGPGLSRRSHEAEPDFAAVLFLASLALFALASYRSNLLATQLVISVAPLGLVAGALAITHAMERAQLWRGVIFAELAVTGVGLSTLAFIGNGKTNTDLMAAYIGAQARSTDLVVLVPGALGPSFNRMFRGSRPQIDFPVRGQIARYEFDNDFERVASLSALHAATDAIAAACRAGRRVWLVTPVKWIIPGEPPIVLDERKFGGIGQASVARANLLERRLRQAFGAAPHMIRSGNAGGGLEFLEARLWGAGGAARTPERGATCDAD